MKQFTQNLPPALQEQIDNAVKSGEFLDAQDYLRFLLRRESKAQNLERGPSDSLRRFSLALRGQENIEDFSELVVETLAKSVDWLYASLYVKQGDWFRKKASYGARGGISLFKADEGQIGQVVRNRSPLLVNNLPEYAKLQFGLGKLSPAHLLLCPVLYKDSVLAILELGGLRALTEEQLLWIEEAANDVGPGLRLALEMEDKRDRQGRELADRTWSGVVFNQLSDPLVITDPSGDILEMNRAAVSLYGWSRSELIGQHITTLVPAESHRQSLQLIARALAGKSVRGITTQRRDKRGRTFEVSLAIDLLKNDEGETTALGYQAVNLTSSQVKEIEYKREIDLLQERLQESQRELEAANGKYKASQLHLSSAVLARSEVLRRLDNKISGPLRALTSFEESTWESRAVANLALFEYHNLSFPFDDDIALDSLDFDLEELLATVRDIHQANIESRELTLHFDLDPDCPKSLQGDPTRLTQVLLNLLANAAEHSDSAHVTLSVEHQQSKGKSHHILFSVQDSGVGLTAKQRKHLLDQNRGGLAICRRLVELMSGDLELMSKRGKGTTFQFHVKFKASKSPKSQKVSKVGRRVLLIDHDKLARQTLIRQLEHLGHEVGVAKSGPQGLSLFREASQSQETYDVILLNWHLPGTNGAEVCQQIQETDPEQEIILLAGSEPDTVREHGEELNIAALLRKPATPSEILSVFTNL